MENAAFQEAQLPIAVLLGLGNEDGFAGFEVGNFILNPSFSEKILAAPLKATATGPLRYIHIYGHCVDINPITPFDGTRKISQARGVFSPSLALWASTLTKIPLPLLQSVQGSHQKPDTVVYPRDVTMKRTHTVAKYSSSDYQENGNVNGANHLPAGLRNQGRLNVFPVDCPVGFNKTFAIGAPARNTQRAGPQHSAGLHHGGNRGESDLRTPINPNSQVTFGNNNLPSSSFQAPRSFIPTTISASSDPSLPVFQPTGEDTELVGTPLDRISNVSSVPQLPRRPGPQDTRSQSEMITTRSAVVPFSFGNNRGRGNRASSNNTPQRPVENPLNRDWSRAMDQAAEVLNNQEDRELQTILWQSYYAVAPNSRPTKEDAMRSIARFLLVMSHRLEARHAAIFLAQSSWHYDSAVRNYLDQRFPDRNRKPRKRRVIQKQTSPQDTRDTYIDSDEDKEIPSDLAITVARDPEKGGIAPAVYHWQIRQHLLRRDHKRYERYVYGRYQGREKYDRTARHPDQLWWGFETRDQYPPIIFVLKPPPLPKEAESKIHSLYWRKHLVLDIDGLPLRDLPHLPSTLASTVESGLLEALCRTDTRTNHRDLRGRQPPIHPTTNAPTPRQVRNQENALAQRMRRFREQTGCLSWKGHNNASKAMEQFLKEKLPRAFKEKNNTSGWRDLTAAEISKIKLQSIGRYAQRSKAKDESKRETYIRTAYDLWKRQLGEEGVDVLSKEDQLTICELLARKGTEQELDPSQGTDDDEDVDEELAYQHDGDFLYEEPDDEDFRTFSPCNEQEEDAIKEALEHSVNEYARLTGDRPLTMDKRLSYATQYNQIVHALRDFFWGCGLGYPPRLVRLQRWAGGIENWRSVGFEFELNGGVETELAES